MKSKIYEHERQDEYIAPPVEPPFGTYGFLLHRFSPMTNLRSGVSYISRSFPAEFPKTGIKKARIGNLHRAPD
jgi:hypothetical protein